MCVWKMTISTCSKSPSSYPSCHEIWQIVTVALLVFFTMSVNAQMLTPGQFLVSESGAATYSIPIQVSPGIAGMEPKLSLNYSSQSGNGLLGMGWSIGGLGGVSRCPRTIAQDGAKGGVNYDSNDRYCLDGQRLIAISGSEGADGTEYRTERESFAKIVSYGSAGNGPAWFKVWTKAGQAMEYGRTTDSRIEAQGKAIVRIWALSRIEDTKGNYLTVNYTKDATNGDYYPSRIDYTGNSKANITPVNSVQFQYEARPDVVPGYQAGSLIKNTQRLGKISVLLNTEIVKFYNFQYQTQLQNNRSTLVSIQECSQTGICLPAVTAQYVQSSNTFQIPHQEFIYTAAGNFEGYSTQLADINGDGIADLVSNFLGVGGWSVYVALAKGDGTFLQPTQVFYYTAAGSFAQHSPQLADVNGDGIPDLVATSSGRGGWSVYVALAKGDGTFLSPTLAFNYTAAGNLEGYSTQLADINGDGIADLVSNFLGVGGWSVYVALAKGDGTFLQPTQVFYYTAAGSFAQHSPQLADVNGDGIPDLVATSSGRGGWSVYVALAKGDGTFLSPTLAFNYTAAGNLEGYSTQLADINGDGIADLVSNFLGVGGWSVYVALAKGDGTFLQPTQVFYYTAAGSFAQHSPQLADVNGDGIPDLVATSSGRGGWSVYVALAKGDGTFLSPTLAFNYTTAGNFEGYSTQLADINGDGIPELVASYTGTSGWGAYISSSIGVANPGWITNLISLDTKTTINYFPLTSRGAYTKDSGNSSVYPIVDVQVPLYVVSSISSSNGIGGAVSTSYTYGGLKSDLMGRGLLGFRWMQTKQIETGLTSYTEYLQTWPYTGLPRLLKKNLAGGGNNGVLSQVTNTYGCNDAANTTAAPCVVGTGKRYFVYANQSVESGWDYNGTVLPVITTNTEYDNWGSAIKVDVSTSDGYAKRTLNTYNNDSSNWYLGRLLKSVVESTAP